MDVENRIEPDALHAELASAVPPVVMDVLSPEAFAERHVDGARNFCAYESAFAGKVRAEIPDLHTAIVVYGESGDTLEGAVAAQKLRAAGYRDVRELAGGIEGWQRHGYPITSQPAKPGSPFSGGLSIDAERSVLFWTGRNLFNHHTGTLRVGGGRIVVKENAFESGEVFLDMKTIACTDLPEGEMREMLNEHLRSPDFFAVEAYPVATFLLESMLPISAARDGIPNYRVKGALTLRGITKAVEFPASIACKEDGTVAAQAFVEIDRTEWGVLYGSARFFARLGQHLVSDHIQLHLKIFATRG